MRNTNIDKPINDGKINKELLADRETYELLLDDYIDGVDVRDDEEITDYLKRKGFKGILDESSNKKKIKSVLMASETPEEEAEMILTIEARQIRDEFERAKKKGYTGSYKDFLNWTSVRDLDSGIRFFRSGGSVKSNGKAKDNSSLLQSNKNTKFFYQATKL